MPGMAQRSTVHRFELSVADMDRGHYATHALTVARHPSETEERMMLRVLAFGLFADASLAFGRGLSTDDEPDLWLRDATGAITLWVDVGLPDEKWVRKACARAARVVLIAYGGARAEAWWRQNAGALARFEHLTVLAVPPEASRALGALADRSVRLSCSIQDGQAWVTTESGSVAVEPLVLKAAPAG
jgi:uncharacterized protein YaeQ